MTAKKANLFLVGAMKAGTTSLLEMMSAHPQIQVSPIKEPNYFVDDMPATLYAPATKIDLNDYFSKPQLDPMHIAHVKDLDQYQKLFAGANARYRMDSSTAYLAAPESARTIHSYNAEARIIIILRDPLQRSYSHFNMAVGLGRESGDFEAAMREDLLDFETGVLAWHSYLGMSLYKEQVKRYTELFQHVLILDFEAFVSDPKTTLDQVADFLELDSFPGHETSHKNKNRAPRFKKLYYLLHRLGLKKVFSRLFPGSFRRWMYRRISKEHVQKLRISQELRARLNAVFLQEANR